VATQIEILNYTQDKIEAVFYYPVPANKYLPASADPNRVIRGTALSAQEIQDVKDGRLVEYYIAKNPKGRTYKQLQNRLVAVYSDLQSKAGREYQENYAGTIYDGTSWT
jgi:hypothetical protein